MTEPLALAGDERILITGASGWLGRSLLSTLLPVLPAQQLMAVGSRARNIDVDGTDDRDLQHGMSEVLNAFGRPTSLTSRT